MEKPITKAVYTPDIKRLEQLVVDGYINKQKHPTADLLIWNYSKTAQFERVWNEDTMNCRGLITDLEGNVRARPFKKFFNFEQLDPSEIPDEPFDVYDKLDGSLGIMYWIEDTPYIATRGSFTSDQSAKANQLLHGKMSHFIGFLDKDITYLFEILYPENRIVVDYGQMEDLVLLATISTTTGEEIPLNQMYPFTMVKRYNGITDYKKLKELATDNAEGFVVRFMNGFRMKLKFDEYMRLHRILTGVSNKAIWEILAVEHLATLGLDAKWIAVGLKMHQPTVEGILSENGKAMDQYLDKVPDEFYDWVKYTSSELKKAYTTRANEINEEFNQLDKSLPYKELALQIKKSPNHSELFRLANQHSCDNLIWLAVYPKFSKAFTVDIDE